MEKQLETLQGQLRQWEFMRAFIERIDLYPEKQKCGNWIRNIVFNFPIPFNGEEVKEFTLKFKKQRVYAIILGVELKKAANMSTWTMSRRKKSTCPAVQPIPR